MMDRYYKAEVPVATKHKRGRWQEEGVIPTEPGGLRGKATLMNGY